MASTEQRSGFRLPWGSAPAADAATPATQADHPTDEASGASDQQETGTMSLQVAEDEAMKAATAAVAAHDEAATAEPSAFPSPETTQAPLAPAADAATTQIGAERPAEPDPWRSAQPDPWRSATAPAAPAGPVASFPQAVPASQTVPDTASRPAVTRPPSRFLADLVRAMRSTAEENRTTLVEGMRTEGKASVEQIHARSAEEVNSLRRVADEDVAGIKDWSKAEIARIRAETEERIAERKQELELSLEGHAALVEREIEHVQARITEYEAEMDAFFVRLEEIDDPSEFASVAAEMPEPPSLEEASAAARAAALDDLIRETATARATSVVDQPAEAIVEPVAAAAVEAVVAAPETVAMVEPVAETVAEPVEAVAEPVAETVAEPVEAIAEPAAEAAAEEIAEPAAEAAADAIAEPVAEAAPEVVDWVAEPVAEPVAGSVDEPAQPSVDDTDPRLAALGLTADAPATETPETEAEIDAMSEATIAARLGDPSPNGQSAPESTTSVVVVGLISVASVAAFKRTLGKTPGVRSVGVSSGPEGEFVFRTTHDADLHLKDVIPTMPGFGARVVAAGEGVVNVSARDPESEA